MKPTVALFLIIESLFLPLSTVVNRMTGLLKAAIEIVKKVCRTSPVCLYFNVALEEFDEKSARESEWSEICIQI